MKDFITGAILLALFGGWIANIVKLFAATAVGEAALRGIGVVFFPLGMLLGFF